MTMVAAPPVTATEFTAAMAAFAPFEARPALAVAVSGGRDSLALVLLAAEWTVARNGTLVALTVDHGLRPEAAGEARRVAGWLGARGIEHHILSWRGPHPASGVQAAAREARYRLLEEFCVARGILHLLLGHQRDDQTETIRMRRARQSTGPGLAGMTALRETAQLRLLRPLLAFPRARLTATLVAHSQAWIDDPSNENPAYERARVRASLRDLPAGAADPAAAAARRAGEAATSRALARCAALLPEGYARLDAGAFAALAAPLRRAVLVRCIVTVGGRAYPPRGDRLDRALAALDAGRLGRGRTLGGCRIVPAPGAHGDAWLIVREAPRGGTALALAAGACVRWDGRFALAAAAGAPADMTVAAVGRDSRRCLAELLAAAWPAHLPAPARHGLPAVRRGGELHAVPVARIGSDTDVAARYTPVRPLGGAGFVAAPGNPPF